jgi:hypothetical protein
MNKICKNELYDFRENSICPFCMNQCIEAKEGKTRCPVCDAAFEIDDRVECVFVDTDNIVLPFNGIVCASRGLVQAEDRKRCLYCGIGINTAVN